MAYLPTCPAVMPPVQHCELCRTQHAHGDPLVWNPHWSFAAQLKVCVVQVHLLENDYISHLILALIHPLTVSISLNHCDDHMDFFSYWLGEVR